MDPLTERRWYLVYTKPRQEEVARENLERQGYEVWLPLARELKRRRHRLSPVIGPMFPRYLFIHLDRTTDNWAPIRSTLGVTSVVRFGMEPAAVPEALIEEIRSRADKDGLMELVPENYRPGGKVRVVAGGLEGIEGIFVARNGQERVTVLLKIMGQVARTTLPAGFIEPVT